MRERVRLQRVDPQLIKMFEEMQEQGEVASFPEFTRIIARDLRKKKEDAFPRFFK